MLENFTLETFLPHLGSSFALQVDASTSLGLELIEVTPLGGAASSTPPAARQAFSLVFRGPLTPVAIQRIYLLEHPTLGAFELFLVPIGPDQQGLQYQAIFT